jgi:hypothetical protein
VRAEGIEPSRPCGLGIFLPLRLSSPRQRRVRGLDYTFTVPHTRFRCRPSSLYTLPEVLRAWFGIAISGFPDFERFYTVGFPMGTQPCLSPLRLPFRHARGKLAQPHHNSNIVLSPLRLVLTYSYIKCYT